MLGLGLVVPAASLVCAISALLRRLRRFSEARIVSSSSQALGDSMARRWHRVNACSPQSWRMTVDPRDKEEVLIRNERRFARNAVVFAAAGMMSLTVNPAQAATISSYNDADTSSSLNEGDQCYAGIGGCYLAPQVPGDGHITACYGLRAGAEVDGFFGVSRDYDYEVEPSCESVNLP